MVLIGAAGLEVCPSSLLFMEIETSGVRNVEPGEEHTSKTEPRNDVELHLCVDVIVQDTGKEGAQFPNSSTEAVC